MLREWVLRDWGRNSRRLLTETFASKEITGDVRKPNIPWKDKDSQGPVPYVSLSKHHPDVE